MAVLLVLETLVHFREEINEEISSKDLNVCDVISEIGTLREEFTHLLNQILASPPLVVIFALIGSVNINLEKDPISELKEKNFYERFMALKIRSR